MWPNPSIAADLVTFTEEILNGKLDFLCSAIYSVNSMFNWTLIFYYVQLAIDKSGCLAMKTTVAYIKYWCSDYDEGKEYSKGVI